jgi:CHAD domain-containing protein
VNAPAASPVASDLFARSPEDGARAVARALLAEARAAAARMADPADGEALHDLRVAVRRLRSWLRGFRPLLEARVPAKREKQLKRLGNASNAARDAEVQVAWLGARREALHPRHRPALDALAARIAEGGGGGHGDARAEVAGRLGKLAPRLEAALAAGGPPAAGPAARFGEAIAGAIRGQAARLRDALGGVTSAAEVEPAHDARIEGKRLRYLLEPLREVEPEARAAVKALKGLQELLGELHDAHVLADVVGEALSHAAAAGARARHAALHGRAPREDGKPVIPRGHRAGLAALDALVVERRDAVFRDLERRFLRSGAPDLWLAVEAAAAGAERTPGAPPVARRRRPATRPRAARTGRTS